MKHAGPLEIEIKLPIPALDPFRRRLEAAGFALAHPQAREVSILWDREGVLAGADCALRLRRYGAQASLTWKGPREPDPRLKVRPEEETGIGDPDALEAILGALGYRPAMTLVKSRSLWRRGDLEACLDETPFGCYLELEGPREAIEAALGELGLEGVAPETRSYPALFRAWEAR